MEDSDETLGEAIEALRAATVRLGKVREENGWHEGEHIQLDEQLAILVGVLDTLESLYDDALNELL